MSESEKTYTPTQEFSIKRFIKIAQLLKELEDKFILNREFDYPYPEDRAAKYHVNKNLLEGILHIRNNMYLALCEDGLKKQADMIMNEYNFA